MVDLKENDDILIDFNLNFYTLNVLISKFQTIVKMCHFIDRISNLDLRSIDFVDDSDFL